jgi:hypothetical protein
MDDCRPRWDQLSRKCQRIVISPLQFRLAINDASLLSTVLGIGSAVIFQANAAWDGSHLLPDTNYKRQLSLTH